MSHPDVLQTYDDEKEMIIGSLSLENELKLQDIFGKEWKGLDDNFEEDFEKWLENLKVDLLKEYLK